MRVSLQHVSHDYAGTEDSAAVHVLEDISLEIAKGDFAVLMGASGSGKSTLLNLMGAVDRPTSGTVLLDGIDTSTLTENGLTRLRRESIGFIFQFFNLIPTLKVSENVGFPLSLARARDIDRRVDEALAQVGLQHRARHYPNELSGGEMQRVAIARAIIHRPSLLLADEPTGNLDSRNGTMILDLIRTIRETYRPTVVMATHSETAARYGDSIIHILDGRVSR